MSPLWEAAGPWSGEVAATLGLELPTRPVKGQLLLADCLAPLCAGLLARSILADRMVDELIPFKPTRRLSS